MYSPSRSILTIFIGIWMFFCPILCLGQGKSLILSDSTLLLKLSSTASQIELDGENNILLLFPDDSQINRYLTGYQYDSLLSIGGKSTREEGFLQPVKISVHNRQLLYVLDETQQRLSLLNKDMKVIQENQFALRSVFDNQNNEWYTISFAVSPAGEIFLLNQFDNKIYKVNLFGEVETSFGGLDFGEGSLFEPEDIQINAANQIFISEPENGNIKIYDMYGIYLYTLNTDAEIVWEHFHLGGGLLFLWNQHHISVMNLLKRETFFLSIPESYRLTDLYFQGQNLYLLLENEVHLYRINP